MDSIARIYVEEVRRSLDPLVVPVFSPDIQLDVGDFGSFEDGRFVRQGNVRDRDVGFGVDEQTVAPFEFASSGKVSFGASTTVKGPGDVELVKAKVSFSRDKAVAVSFDKGCERTARDPDSFGAALATAWGIGELRADRVVVWSIRRALGGTALVSAEGENEIELSADPSVVGGAITLGTMRAGVSFGSERKATWKLSVADLPLTTWVRLIRSDRNGGFKNAFGFEARTEAARDATAGAISAFTADHLLAMD